jgi:hypothetical protein
MKNIMLFCALFVALSAQAQTPLLTEDFNYTDSLTTKGWIPVSAWGTNGLYARATGLTHTGYANSGIGNAVDMVASGEDSKRDLSAPVTAGNLYASFLINLKTAAKTAGGYITGFTSGATGSNYNLRFYVKSDSIGGFYMGIGRGTTPATYSANRYAANTSYLVTMKYGFNTTALLNDTVGFYVHPTASTTTVEPEPAGYAVHNLGAGTGSDATELTSIFLRQGTATDSITLTMDGIRIATTWRGSVALSNAVNSIEKSSFKVYPSVTKGMVNLSFDKIGATADVSVVNVQGQVVLAKKLPHTDSGQSLDLSTLSNGTYIIRLVSDNTIMTQLVEKQ